MINPLNRRGTKGTLKQEIGAHLVENISDRLRNPINFRLHHILRGESVQLPDDVNDLLYGNVKSTLQPLWKERVTRALVQGTLPEGMTLDDIIEKVRASVNKEKL